MRNLLIHIFIARVTFVRSSHRLQTAVMVVVGAAVGRGAIVVGRSRGKG
jgi:hypothetical protein